MIMSQSSSGSKALALLGAGVTALALLLARKKLNSKTSKGESESKSKSEDSSAVTGENQTQVATHNGEISTTPTTTTSPSAESSASDSVTVPPPAHMMAEQLVRNFQFFGDRGQARICGAQSDGNSSEIDSSSSLVIVVGAGGVGSHAAVTLARSGVSRIRLVDFDQVSLSSLNRHACAFHADVGVQKVQCVKKFVEKFNPWTRVEAVEALFEGSRSEELLLDSSSTSNSDSLNLKNNNNNYSLTRNPAFVIDCIDNLKTKCDLIEFCHRRGIRLVISGGSAAKCDPTKLRMSSLAETVECELSRAVRQELRERERKREEGAQSQENPEIVGGLNTNFVNKTDICDFTMVVYSTERTSRGLMPLKAHQEESDKPEDYAPLQNFRVRTLPVIAPLPAIFGNALASYVLCHLAGQPFLDTKFDSSQPGSPGGINNTIFNPDGTITVTDEAVRLILTNRKTSSREPLKKKAWRRFMESAKSMFGGQESHLLDCEDSELLIHDFYRNKGIVSGKQIGQLHLVPVDRGVVEKLDRILSAEPQKKEIETPASDLVPSGTVLTVGTVASEKPDSNNIKEDVSSKESADINNHTVSTSNTTTLTVTLPTVPVDTPVQENAPASPKTPESENDPWEQDAHGNKVKKSPSPRSKKAAAVKSKKKLLLLSSEQESQSKSKSTNSTNLSTAGVPEEAQWETVTNSRDRRKKKKSLTQAAETKPLEPAKESQAVTNTYTNIVVKKESTTLESESKETKAPSTKSTVTKTSTTSTTNSTTTSENFMTLDFSADDDLAVLDSAEEVADPLSFPKSPSNWLLVCQGEAVQLSAWFKSKKEPWTGPVPDFLRDSKEVRERIIRRMREAEKFFEAVRRVEREE